MRRVFIVLIVIMTIPIGAQRRRAVDPQPAERETKILFIGNSLTYVNDLPAMVCRLAAAAGHPASCASVVAGDYALEDHFQDGIAAQRLANEKWSIVVLQQGPSALESSRINLREWTARFAPLIRAAGAQPALYAVWPSEERFGDFPRVSQSYHLAASDVGGLFFPAGDAWLAAWKRDPSLKLYADDDFHPSPIGSYLAALVMVRVIWGSLPPRFSEPSLVPDFHFDAAHLAMLTAAADEAVATSLGEVLYRITRIDPRVESARERPHLGVSPVDQHARHTGG